MTGREEVADSIVSEGFCKTVNQANKQSRRLRTGDTVDDVARCAGERVSDTKVSMMDGYEDGGAGEVGESAAEWVVAEGSGGLCGVVREVTVNHEVT